MSDPNQAPDPFVKQQEPTSARSAPSVPPAQPPAEPYGGGLAQAPGTGPIGKVRHTGVCILLFIVTFGIYGYVWWGMVHADMRRHTGTGIDALLAVIIAIFISPVTAFLTCNEVQNMYLARGQEPPVRTTTGLWYFPGSFIIIGPIVWFVKTNAALNDYWRSLGAPD